MESKPLKQQAEFRVIAKSGSEYALLVRATIRNEDLYCGVQDSGEEILRTSHHERGQVHTYMFGGAKRDRPRSDVPLGSFRGCQRIWAVGVDMEQLTWGYQPSAESKTRRNFVIDLETVALPVSIDVWMIERGRGDLLVDIMHNYSPPDPIKRLISSSMVDWTHPWLYAVAWGPSNEVVDSLEKFAEQEGLPPGKITGMVVGPGPPVGDIQTMSRGSDLLPAPGPGWSKRYRRGGKNL